MKVFNHRQYGAKEAYDREKYAYSRLDKPLQGMMPRFLHSAFLVHNAAPVIVTTYEGKGYAQGQAVSKGLQKPLQNALKALHAEKAAHGAVSSFMFVAEDGVVKLVNFDQAVFRPSKQLLTAEKQGLQAYCACIESQS